MNLPPSATPPGGYYVSPPPPNRSSSGGCWKAAGIGCAVIFLLALIGGFLAVRSFKHQLAHPDKNSVIGTAVAAGKAGASGIEIEQAIKEYHTQHGKYPNSLMDMVQEGSLDGKQLHNDLDDSPDPGHLSWHYTKPDEGAPGTTPILEEPYHITIGGNTQTARIVIQLDGKVAANTPGGIEGQ